MRRIIILISITALLAVATPAHAATGWSAPRSVATPELRATNAQAAADAQGRAIVAWERHNEGFDAIRAAAETSKGEFGETQTLSTGAESGLHLTGVASDDDGDAIVVWCSTIDGNLAIRFAERLGGGSFGGAQTLSTGPATSCADVAMNRGGAIAAAWTQDNRVVLSTKQVGGLFDISFGSISPPAWTGPPAKAVSVALDGARTAWLAWQHPTSGGSSFRVVRGKRPHGGPLNDEFVSPSYQGVPGVLDVASDSSLAASWTGPDPKPSVSSPAGYGVSGAADGLGPTSKLDLVALDYTSTGVSVAGGGSAFFYRSGTHVDAGTDPEFCPYKTHYVGWAAAGQTPAPVAVPVSANPEATYDSISAASSADATLLAWREFPNYEPGCVKPSPVTATSVIRAAAQVSGPTLATPVNVSDPRYPASDPSLNSSQQLAAAWTCFDGRKYRVQVATYGANAGEPLWCGPEDLDPPKVKVKTTRYPLRWRSTSKPSPRASCHEQCTVTVGLLLFSRGHRAAKLGVSEQVLKPNKAKRLDFPKLGRGERRLVARAVRRRSNVRLIYRLRFDDLAANSVLKTARVRLY